MNCEGMEMSQFAGPIHAFRSTDPNARYSRTEGPPTPQVAIARIEMWLMEIESVAGNPVGYMIAEEFGRLGGRYHCHALA